jgi:hypothetical protein
MAEGLRGWLAGLAMLALGACASAPSPPQPEDVAALPPWRGRLVATALAEWRDWGGIVLDGWPEALPREADPRLYDKVLLYWNAVPVDGPGVIRRHQQVHDALVAGLMQASAPAFPEAAGYSLEAVPAEAAPPMLPSISLWAYPAWSAAFISHLMSMAGVPGFVFPPSGSHAGYLDPLLIQAGAAPKRAAFVPHDPGHYAPRAGDLLCADRSASPLLHWQERLGELGQFRPLHCDLVVAAGAGQIQAVGGNVIDVVALRRFPADRGGLVLPAPPDKAPFLVVLENRLDLSP